jgi:hypothetical protein
MSYSVLLRKLIVIERAIGMKSSNALLNLIYEAEECVLQIQREQANISPMRQFLESEQPLQVLTELAEGQSIDIDDSPSMPPGSAIEFLLQQRKVS